ncbi:MAG: malonyl-ACP O-methyltransferase BioC [Pseudomonadota bacterium]
MSEHQVFAEFLPATRSALSRLVLLHGWGCNREAFRPLLVQLRPWADVTLLELPGASDELVADELTLESVLEQLLAAAPAEPASYVGWSLGGQLVTELARRAPERVSTLVTLCYNPLYLGDGADWPGLGESTLQEFARRIRDDAQSTLNRFDILQSEGSPQAAELRRYLRGQRRTLQPLALLQSLTWLGLDQRAVLPRLPQAQLHLFGPNDSLVDASIPERLRSVLSQGPAFSGQCSIQTVPATSHMLPLEAPGQVAARIAAHLGLNLADEIAQPSAPVSKRDVAASFGRCAASYDAVADLQRKVGAALLARLDDQSPEPATVLDLGSGTGAHSGELRRRLPHAKYIGLDLAEGMARFARGNYPRESWLVGDAEALPLASSSVDLIFSSLALQWCYRPRLLMAEIARILRPGGLCLFSTLGPGTLGELRDAWAAVDEYRHVNTFLPGSELQQSAALLPGVKLELERTPIVMRYQRVQDLLRELKGLGAHNVNHERPSGLTTPSRLRAMFAVYEAQRERGYLPATYDVLYGTLEKV